MRTFSCFSFNKDQNIPGLIFISTDSLQRARDVARRELALDQQSEGIEIFEGTELLWCGTHEEV